MLIRDSDIFWQDESYRSLIFLLDCPLYSPIQSMTGHNFSRFDSQASISKQTMCATTFRLFYSMR